MRELNFMNRLVRMDIRNWGVEIVITIYSGFNVTELNAIKEEMEEWLKILGCGGGSVKIYVRETSHRLTIIVTPPEEFKK
jgi:hypothetical protein